MSKKREIRWRNKRLNTICAVTEAIKDESNVYPDTSDVLDTIFRLADTAQAMGQAMEDGLNTKRSVIEELEARVAILESENEAYWTQIEQLQDEVAAYEHREEKSK